MEWIPFVLSGIFSSILFMNVLVRRRNLLIISGSFSFFRLLAISLPAVLSTHLSLTFPACPSVSPAVSLVTVQIINSLLCLVRQLPTSPCRSTGNPSIWTLRGSFFCPPDWPQGWKKTYSCHLFLTNFILWCFGTVWALILQRIKN